MVRHRSRKRLPALLRAIILFKLEQLSILTVCFSLTTEVRVMPLYWLRYRHNNQMSGHIEPGALDARMRASLADLDEGEFTEGHELDRKSVVQVDDLMSVDTEGHLLLTRQLDDEFQLLAGQMHQLDSHIALDLGNFSAEEIAAQEFEAQHVERSR